MQMGRRLRAGSRLFVVYAVASLVPVAVLGAVLLHGYQDQGKARGRAQGEAQAAVIEEMAIAPALNGADLSKGLTRPQRDQLHAVTELAIFNGSVARLRLRTFTGAVPSPTTAAWTAACP